MKYLVFSITIFMSIFAASCVTKKVPKQTNPKQTAPVVETINLDQPQVGRGPQGVYPMIKINRSACYGQCPSYNATINSDGTVEFVGFAHVENLGANAGVIDKEALKNIMRKAQEIDYIGMNSEYPVDGRNIPDLPTVTTEITFGDMIKQVKDHFDSPASLQELETMIDEAVRAIKYRPVTVEKK